MFWRCALAVASLPSVALPAGSGSCFPLEGREVGASFALCCQVHVPAVTEKHGLCGAAVAHDCHRAAWCQEEALVAGTSSRQAPEASLLDLSRGPVRLPEMQLYFEVQMFPYLTFDVQGVPMASDPVFLDIELVLPAILLALAAEAAGAASEEGARPQPPSFIDVGAHEGAVGLAAIGLWDAILATAPSWPSAALPAGGAAPRQAPSLAPLRVLALEPDPDRCTALNESVDALKGSHVDRSSLRELVDGRITAVCAAAMASAGESFLHCPPGMHCHVSSEVMSDFTAVANVTTESVRVTTVDEVAEAHGLREVGVLKVDAEGADFDVLRGAQRLLSEQRIRFVIFEVSVLWESWDAVQTGAKPTKTHRQLPAVLDYLDTIGDYMCFIIGPEMLVPVSRPWLVSRYIYTSHQFNLMCAPRDDPALKVVLQLYNVVPRNQQFALAALPPASRARPYCWACRDPSMSDAALRRRAASVERYFAAVYHRAIHRGWGLPHFRFMRGRWLQSAGQADEAHEVYRVLAAECCHEPSSFQASRERHQMTGRLVKPLWAGAAPLTRRNSTLQHTSMGALHTRAEEALQLAWLHLRPGSGAAFGEESACAAQAWYRWSGRAGHDVGAFFVGMSLQYGECSGRMALAGIREAMPWYERSKKFNAEHARKTGQHYPVFAEFADHASSMLQNLVAEAQFTDVRLSPDLVEASMS